MNPRVWLVVLLTGTIFALTRVDRVSGQPPTPTRMLRVALYPLIPWEEGLADAVKHEFEKAHPDVRIEFVDVASHYYDSTKEVDESDRDQRAAFNTLLQKSGFLRGAGFRAPHLNSEEVRGCYRARHWYPALD